MTLGDILTNFSRELVIPIDALRDGFDKSAFIMNFVVFEARTSLLFGLFLDDGCYSFRCSMTRLFTVVL